MQTAIEISNLTKRYKDVVALDHFSLTVNSGEIFALLGENGAGKSTLIKILCGLTKADEGCVSLLGKDLFSQMHQLKSVINVSPQETAVALNLTVAENLTLISQLYGSEKVETKRKVDEIIEDLGLGEVRQKHAKKLSGGYKRRLSIGMALITNPKILFLDEPTIGLDVRARRELWQVIENLKGKTTVVLTTHYLEEAQALADTIGIMEKGKIKAVGSLESLRVITGQRTLEEIFLNLTQGGEV